MKSSVVTIFLLFYTSFLLAGEADYFTNRYHYVDSSGLSEAPNLLYEEGPKLEAARKENLQNSLYLADLPDESKKINNETNIELDKSIAAANLQQSELKPPQCQDHILEKEIYSTMNGSVFGLPGVPAADGLPRRAKAQSYFAFHPENKFGTVYAEKKTFGCCGNIVNIGGHYVSLDKFGHFFVHGFEAKITSSPGMIGAPSSIMKPYNDEAALKMSDEQEAGTYGLWSTKVYSFADKTANYEGYQFWKNSIHGPKPIFKCEAGRWSKVRDFDWREYITDAWDEGINCNSYADNDLADSIQKRVAQLQTAAGKSVTSCPVEPDKCSALAKRYTGSLSELIHPDCLKAADKGTRSKTVRKKVIR